MSDDRLLHSRDADALDLELLDAGAAEHPAPHAKSRTLAALGLGVPHVAQADVGVAASGSVGGAAGHACAGLDPAIRVASRSASTDRRRARAW